MINIGIDLVEHSRFENMINNQRKYERILSEDELKVFSNIKLDSRKIEYLASRFAAKEAIIKAVNKERISLAYKNISIVNDNTGAPYVKFSFEVSFEISISISHTDSNSVAFAVMSRK